MKSLLVNFLIVVGMVCMLAAFFFGVELFVIGIFIETLGWGIGYIFRRHKDAA